MCERNRIIRYAKGAIGCEYSRIPSGGVEGESYNCSFLTFCAYRYAGLKIPKWQGHQHGNGSQSDWVRWAGNWCEDASELEKGDLVFFGDSPNYTFHVGIALGNGYSMIDSVPNGGVQERFIYDSFIGGGWPFDIGREHKECDLEMQGLILVKERDCCVYLDAQGLHDVSDPKNIEALDKVAIAFTGEPLRRVEYSAEDYANLCQVLRAGMPASLADLATKYEPRSV